jgi:hypothetical protein
MSLAPISLLMTAACFLSACAQQAPSTGWASPPAASASPRCDSIEGYPDCRRGHLVDFRPKHVQLADETK